MRILSIALFTVLLQACAFSDAKLQVHHNDSADLRGPLSEVSNLSIAPPVLTDKRSDQARIGWKKNGFGQNTADITTEAPVGTIVKDAIEAGFSRNGHSILDNGRVEIRGTIDSFWFEISTQFMAAEFIGAVSCSLTFYDKQSGEAFYSSSYSGSHAKKAGGGMKKSWEAVMSRSVDKLIEDLVFDEDLVEALGSLD